MIIRCCRPGWFLEQRPRKFLNRPRKFLQRHLLPKRLGLILSKVGVQAPYHNRIDDGIVWERELFVLNCIQFLHPSRRAGVGGVDGVQLSNLLPEPIRMVAHDKHN